MIDLSHRRKLLVVDDEPDYCEFVCYVAEVAGYQTVFTSQPEQFLALYSDDISVIVLDLSMPTMDGIEIIRQLADQQNSASLILLSGLDESLLHSASKIARGRGINVLATFTKPVSYDVLLEVLNKADGSDDRSQAIAHSTLSFDASELQSALSDQQIFPHYQPKVAMDSRRVIGVEALARWKHPQKGLLLPNAFIHEFEKQGLIKALSDLMLDRAIEQCAQWNQQGLQFHVAVNLSPKMLNDLDFPGQLMERVQRHGVNPAQLVLEVTESALFDELILSLDILTRLRMKGFRLSIDDYGTGYSSMSQLMSVPFTELKIDRAFVVDADTDREARLICESTIDLAHKLNMEVVAEGIETQTVFDIVQQLGCDVAQGYLISRPLAIANFAQWHNNWG